MLCKCCKQTRDFLVCFYFKFSLIFYILGAFLIKVIPFVLVGYEICLVGYLPSHIQRALIDNYRDLSVSRRSIAVFA